MSDLMQDETRCKAKRRNGEPCRNPPMLGSTVCRTHGGAAPQVKRAAQVRLLMAADRVAATLLQIAEDKAVPVAVRLSAIRDVLDRAGLGAKQGVDIEVAVSGEVSLYERVLMASTVDIRGAKPDDWDDNDLDGSWWAFSGQEQPDPNVIDAEIVEDVRERQLDETTAERERARTKRQRKGISPELPPSEARKFDITQDPKERPRSEGPGRDRRAEREALLLSRLDPPKKRRRRT